MTLVTTTTCTVVVSADGGRCGKPAVTTFTSKRTGDVFAECVDHATTVSVKAVVTPTAATLGIKTASGHRFVLVRDDKVVGYADDHTLDAVKRAARLGARIIPTK